MDNGGWLRAALGAMLLAVAPTGAADHIGVMGRQHGEWTSGVLIGERPTRYRILTEQVESGSYTELAVDLIEGDCERRFATFHQRKSGAHVLGARQARLHQPPPPESFQ